MIVGVAICCGAYFAREPWQVWRQQRAKANASIEQAETNDALHVGLLKRQAEMKSPIGREKMAREHGYVRQGETPVGTDTP
jgi:hypothetical protein